MLNEEKAIRPAYRMVQLQSGQIRNNFYNEDDKHVWYGTTVGAIISKPEYRGATVNFRKYKESYKDKYHRRNPKEKWVIFENTTLQ